MDATYDGQTQKEDETNVVGIAVGVPIGVIAVVVIVIVLYKRKKSLPCRSQPGKFINVLVHFPIIHVCNNGERYFPHVKACPLDSK